MILPADDNGLAVTIGWQLKHTRILFLSLSLSPDTSPFQSIPLSPGKNRETVNKRPGTDPKKRKGKKKVREIVILGGRESATRKEGGGGGEAGVEPGQWQA